LDGQAVRIVQPIELKKFNKYTSILKRKSDFSMLWEHVGIYNGSKVCSWLVESYEAGWQVCGREIASPYDQHLFILSERVPE
jgi:hypothetical protein